ncbi:acyltransferase [Citricoccus sp. SGAir0253]|uniref:acyltransferase family protein n=1 Tax=Citricoccus sp. SGAir0253 TaxID=2567881 RepID=UPI0010CCE0C6|nr:acyltransferase [Citricoccus sp. SGAir0253]QCU77458.1 acyltransferase [Citricoccus sp. SGAir0253]
MVATAQFEQVGVRQADPTTVRRAPAPAPAPTPAPAAPAASRPRLALLDALRLLAALSVLLFHWTAWHHGNWGRHGEPAAEAWPWLSQFTSVGALGVQLFFIISGFVILLSSFGKSPARFIGSRVGRLYPAYWLAVLLAAVLIFLVWPELGAQRRPADLWANLTMFQGGFGVGHLDGVYWTLWVEMKFYLWILAFTLVGMTVRRVMVFAVAWPLLGNALYLGLRVAGLDVGWVQHLLFPEYSALFAGGMVLFLLFRFGHTPGRWAALSVNVALACAWSAGIQRRETLELTGYDYPLALFLGLVLALFAAVALIVLTPLARVRLPGATLAGALTYPLYLLHQLWGWYLIRLLSPHLPAAVVLALSLAAVLGAAWTVHRWVESPLGPRLQRAVTAGLGRWPVLGRVHGPAPVARAGS